MKYEISFPLQDTKADWIWVKGINSHTWWRTPENRIISLACTMGRDKYIPNGFNGVFEIYEFDYFDFRIHAQKLIDDGYELVKGI
jgi:hypothetical protein